MSTPATSPSSSGSLAATVAGTTGIAVSEALPTFEDLIRAILATQTGGGDWATHAWPPGTGLAAIRQALNSGGPLPGWRLVNTMLDQIGAPAGSYPAVHAAYERAKLYRPWADTVRIQQGNEQPGNFVIHNSGTVYLQPERRHGWQSNRVAEPVIEDVPGHHLKPDPFEAASFDQLEELARAFWRWADRPSSRKIAEFSRGAFSHATIAKIIHDKPNKPRLKQVYLLGLIRGCGGDAQEQQRWVTAWRRLDQGLPPLPPDAWPPPTKGEFELKGAIERQFRRSFSATPEINVNLS